MLTACTEEMHVESRYGTMFHRVALAAAFVAAFAAFSAMGAVRRDSTTFDFKYEMEVVPSSEDLDQDGYDDFVCNGNSTWLTATAYGYA